ncbi:NAD-dependent epimerase/dehydratase family protein [Legionella cardiaca]|uniref:NAD-dependent epimerase/dehydratase family protein n=1 Tax=Legionella cardiaca TaxID=1071983 RepID=A0ABY8AMJ5_9GAMM|nr:NAD-dependent epimerase/dehydratase family protein [Legionella cardiaca]WED41914.1 NAD-dependent epimerase/dehydratase family protein [Legionella cardiaca]
MAKILVTGATGFVGMNLVPQLQSMGHEVRCAVWKPVSWLKAEQVKINKIESQTDWSAPLKDVEIVIHLAAKVHDLEGKEQSLDEYCKVNSIATREFAEQAAQNKIKRFIFLSSIKVMGEYTARDIYFTESCRENPDDPYAKSKLLAEQYLKDISNSTAMEVIILRPPLVYGPGVKANFLRMMTLVAKRWPLPFAKVKNRRSFLYIDNLVSAICTVLSHPKAANKVFLVADNEHWSLAELLKMLSAEMKIKSRLFPVPVKLLTGIFSLLGLKRMRTRLLDSLLVSNNKIKMELGWEPPVKANEGIRHTVQWYQDENNC